MFRAALVLCLLGLAAATPAVVRSRDEIEAYRNFLESTKTSNEAQFLALSQSNPNANAEELSGKYQGDIVLDDVMIQRMVQQYSEGRNAYIWPNSKWPNNTVVWELARGSFGPLQSSAIESAIKVIEDNTCVKFRYRRPADKVYVRVTGGGNGCYANVGYWQQRGVHTLNLARDIVGFGCFRHATIVHEWLHILGFLHMQSTHNRNEYVKIVEENLRPGTENNFQIYGKNLASNLGIEYDYVSCMHYGPYAFSRNGQKTIIALKKHEGTMGQRKYITDKDWLRVNRHYNCPGAWN